MDYVEETPEEETQEEETQEEEIPEYTEPDKEVLDLTRKVMAGSLGLGDKRKNALGDRYDEVMAEVRRRRLRSIGVGRNR